MKRWGKIVLVMVGLALAWAEYASANTGLDAFLMQIKERAAQERLKDEAREREFRADLESARRRVQEARGQLEKEKVRQERLLEIHDAHEARLTELEAELREHQGGLGEMFGALRQSAGDFHAHFVGSLAMADRSEALDFVSGLSNSRSLPGMKELERFWLVVLEEMVQSGRVDRFHSEVVLPDGTRHEGQVLRVGAFNAVADGAYLSHVQGRNQFIQLPRQPAGRYLSQARELEKSVPGEVRFFALDPSRGAILEHLVQSPSLRERVMQGREIGIIILALGAVGLGVFMVRFTVLTGMDRRMRRQMQSDRPVEDNPLGRIQGACDQSREADPEMFEVKLDEAILREAPQLERGLTTIKILAAVAPLLGLLGTVVGMIETFQSITLFGTGDPQLMAGGISQALVTTALGLSVAIPLLLLHSVASAKSRKLLSILEEQGAGLLAGHMHKVRGAEAHG